MAKRPKRVQQILSYEAPPPEVISGPSKFRRFLKALYSELFSLLLITGIGVFFVIVAIRGCS